MNMMKPVAVLFIFEIHSAFAGSGYNIGRDQSLHVQEDWHVKECWYRGYNLTKNFPKKMEKPCEQWTCKFETDFPQVIVEGCGAVSVSGRYVEEVSQNPQNLFPNCCTKSAAH
uniref:Single domain-containing protein n=1 Tax=Amblyomma parvum TaxID=251391 RepID=A0A023FXE2_AMBPA